MPPRGDFQLQQKETRKEGQRDSLKLVRTGRCRTKKKQERESAKEEKLEEKRNRIKGKHDRMKDEKRSGKKESWEKKMHWS